MANNRLTRDMRNAMLGGVCAGIARHYNYDVTLVRVVWLILTALSVGFGVVLYIATWIIMPRENGEAATSSSSDIGEEMLSVGERITESARVVAKATREATEEIAEIARGRSTPTQSADSADAEAAGAVPTEQPTVDGERRTPAAGDPHAVPEEEDRQPASYEQEQEQPAPRDAMGEQEPERREGEGEPPAGPRV